MEIIKKYKVVLVFALVVLVGVFFFFYRMYHNDVKALENFSAAYEKFDRAMSDFSIGEVDGAENKASEALSELNSTASFRLSSLIKNDSVIPPLALEIAEMSRKELDNLRAYKKAIHSKSADMDTLAKEYGDLTSKRKAAYASFEELANSTHSTNSRQNGEARPKVAAVQAGSPQAE